MTDPAQCTTVDGHTLLVTFQQPEKLNAFSAGMAETVMDALRRADTDDAIRSVVLTGSGRAFCAGADFSSNSDVFGSPDPDSFSSDPLSAFHPWDCRKPVIAAINGHAVGIGLTITLQCDLRIVAEDAKLGVVQNRRGVLPDAHAHWTLPRLIGHSRATDLLLTGRMFSGQDAADWGLASEAVPADQVLDRALARAADIAAHVAPLSIAASKQLLWLSAPTREDINHLEHQLHLELMGREDAREGVRAFLDRRNPTWTLSPTKDWPSWLNQPPSS